jgi:signal transduction histidine kinase
MFKLVRYFSLTSLVALSAASIASGVLYKHLATEDLLKFGENENVFVTRSLANSLWIEFKPFLLSTTNLSDEELRFHPETQRLRQSIITRMQGLPVAKIKIFDLQGRTIFSTETANIGQDYSERPGFLAARSGTVTTKLDHRDTFSSLNGAITERKLISSYVPLRLASNGSSSEIEGVFELYSDVTPLVEKVQSTQRLVFLVSAGLWSVVYVFLLLIVKRAARILKQQHEAQQQTEVALRISEQQAHRQADELDKALQELRESQTKQLIQAEKMSSLGRMLAGVAHEINNPVNFICGNTAHASEYAQALIELLHTYDEAVIEIPLAVQEKAEELDREFLEEDLPKVLASMQVGADRARQIVLSLRNFSRLDEAEAHLVDVHETLDSTLLILNNRTKQGVSIVRRYEEIPQVKGFSGMLYQVFMNILSNALDALLEKPVKCPEITISTSQINENWVSIRIADNGCGITPEHQSKIFETFFTTKPVGVGTGLGLAI